MAFDREITNVCKGAAILLLLCHHLFLDVYGDRIGPALQVLGVSGKLCVGIFLLLSGFGLARSRGGGMSFRIVRLLVNFWFVAIPFIVLSCLFTDHTFATLYSGRPVYRFPMEMLCLPMSPYGFNPTWWFMGVALFLYLIYPILRRIADRSAVAVLIVAILPWLLGVRPGEWLLPFAVGMLLGRTTFLERLAEGLSRADAFALVPGIALLLVVRARVGMVAPLEGVLAAAFVFSVFGVCRLWGGPLRLPIRFFAFLGVHSMNVFLLHTFLFAVFFPAFFKAQHPLVGLVALLGMSLACSWILEAAKRLLRVECGMDFLRSKLPW